VGAIVARFGQDWRQSLDQINREILSSFPNLRLGTGILQQTLTTLVQYYHRSGAKTFRASFHVIFSFFSTITFCREAYPKVIIPPPTPPPTISITFLFQGVRAKFF
jgi:hypothetical protein